MTDRPPESTGSTSSSDSRGTTGAKCALAVKGLMGIEAITWGSGSSWRTGTGVPDHIAAPIQLMCFELLPYALLRAGHISEKTFLLGMRNRSSTKYDGGSEAWAGFLCDPVSKDRVPVDELAGLRTVAGDVIVMIGGSADAFHTVTVSGTASTGPAKEGPMIYSLADRSPTSDPTEMTLGKIIAQFLPYETVAVQVLTVKPSLLE
ncbi:hypothetical protein ACQP2T_40250 [Nonomuraea sp. CA-143628]|uniref:hypothetical protein n=1 Tax=Nonomuraea sp. CA-143628 TaxID=3239997 RepID=UPI003D9136EE